jgi:hypothetical protein
MSVLTEWTRYTETKQTSLVRDLLHTRNFIQRVNARNFVSVETRNSVI